MIRSNIKKNIVWLVLGLYLILGSINLDCLAMCIDRESGNVDLHIAHISNCCITHKMLPANSSNKQKAGNFHNQTHIESSICDSCVDIQITSNARRTRFFAFNNIKYYLDNVVNSLYYQIYFNKTLENKDYFSPNLVVNPNLSILKTTFLLI